jgi:CRISPR/Cas system-associated endonuclease Cas1
LTMKQYWKCYDLALKGVSERFGHRTKARFVRESVTNPAARARGYTAVDAAINYLHQRRLFKAREINAELGLAPWPGEGFLHRKRYNPEDIGLLLDLIDPFKFADREKLLEAILGYSINWRDFYGATDRQGVRFYYPKPEAVVALEAIGNAADKMTVRYEGDELVLADAYRKSVSALIQNLEVGTSFSFVPFVF